MIEKNRVELIFEGLPENEGLVSVSAFLSQLKDFSSLLSKIDKENNSGKNGAIFNIGALSSNSPLWVAIDIKANNQLPFLAEEILNNFQSIAEKIESGHNLDLVNPELLLDFQSFTKPIGKTIKRTTVNFGEKTIQFTPKDFHNIEAALACDDECIGSIEGKLEQINIHQNKNTFQIFPQVGAKKIICHFPPNLLDDAIMAVGKKVEIYGTLKYRANADFPHLIEVNEIEAFPHESDLPDWDDLRGLAPQATGSLSSAEFIRELRDAW